MECYVFDTEQGANDAINFINSNEIFPVTGINALTKESAPDKQKTLKWANAAKQRVTDNKWYFKRIPEYWRNQQTQEQIDYFNNTYPHSIEEYSNDWIESIVEV